MDEFNIHKTLTQAGRPSTGTGAVYFGSSSFLSNPGMSSTYKKNDTTKLMATNSIQHIRYSPTNLISYLNNEPNYARAKIELHYHQGSHPFHKRTIWLMPNTECKIGRMPSKEDCRESNAIFDCKVLSRNHAVMAYTSDGKFWIKDSKSCNGTFLNDVKVGTEAVEMHSGNVVKFGVDVLDCMRNEVCAAVIANVKLYLPNGIEAVKLDKTATQREYLISYDELNRLNFYIRQACHREQILKSKLSELQIIITMTGINLDMSWQSLIGEDELLQRIHFLESKLQQAVQENTTESVLKNEVIRLLDEKEMYERTTKQALVRAYQERSIAFGELIKMQSNVRAIEIEVYMLGEQINVTQQTLRDIWTRLVGIQGVFNIIIKRKEAAQGYAIYIATKTNQLLSRELECRELRLKVEQLLYREEMLKQQKQARKKHDAVNDGMDDDEKTEIAVGNSVSLYNGLTLEELNLDEAEDASSTESYKETIFIANVAVEWNQMPNDIANKFKILNDTITLLENDVNDDYSNKPKYANENSADGEEEDEFVAKRKALKPNIILLRQTYNGIFESLMQLQSDGELISSSNSSSQTDFQCSQSNSIVDLWESEDSQSSLAEVSEDSDEKYNTENAYLASEHEIGKDLREFQEKIMQLNGQLENIENDTSNELKRMQIPCDELKAKISEREKLVYELKREKQELREFVDNDTMMNEDSEKKDVISVASSFDDDINTEVKSPMQLQEEQEIALYDIAEQMRKTYEINMQLKKEFAELKKQALYEEEKNQVISHILPVTTAIVLFLLLAFGVYFTNKFFVTTKSYK